MLPIRVLWNERTSDYQFDYKYSLGEPWRPSELIRWNDQVPHLGISTPKQPRLCRGWDSGSATTHPATSKQRP